MELFTGAFVVWILFGVAAAIAATNKGRSGCGWFVLGSLLGPFGLIFALLVSRIEPAVSSPTSTPAQGASDWEISQENETKKCPMCAEMVKLEAIKCRFCGHLFDPGEVARQMEEARNRSGRKQCPQCGNWDVYRALVGEGREMGDWCPHCKKSLQKMKKEGL